MSGDVAHGLRYGAILERMTLSEGLTVQCRRLPSGGRIDRSHSLAFRFNGLDYRGFRGDTLASALLANGVRLTARSFKYHRPRGIVGVGSEEPATLVELKGYHASANQSVTTIRLEDGMSARSVNCWPSPGFDIGALNQVFARLIPAGFYYKTFKWPNWRLYEPALRRAAGLAGAPEAPPGGLHFEAVNAHTDVLVVGAGPAGLMAALVAGRSGCRVMLVDERVEAGGSLLDRRLEIDGRPSMEWVDHVVAQLAAMPNVTHFQDATVWAYREHNFLMVNERSPANPSLLERNWRVRAGHVILATGAIERSLVFPNNDRPGAMLASAAQAYVNRFAVKPGGKVVVFTNNDSAYAAAADLHTAGMDVVTGVDGRTNVPEDAREMIGEIPLRAESAVIDVLGRRSVEGAVIARRDGAGCRALACDLLLHSGGWDPAVHLFSQSRGSLCYDEELATFVPDRAAQPCTPVGGAAGVLAWSAALGSGAGAAAGVTGVAMPCLPDVTYEAYRIEPLWHSDAPGAESRAFLDIQNDVTVADVHLALREGYDNIEHVKRYTTGGMGFDQGKTGNVNIIGTVAAKRGSPVREVGTTTFRPPYTPVSFGAIGGLRGDAVVFPYRHTPITRWNLDRGAFMYEAGARWRRPGYFPRGDEKLQEAVNRECRAVRESVGVYDGSPLGKFEIKGKDAGRFLDHLYTNVMSTLEPGRCRYGLMLTDDGLILDDGVAMRLGEHRWLISTSTGNADAVHGHMQELLQTRFPDWGVFLTVVTCQWGNATVCGPRSREVLAAMGADIDLAPEALPFMSYADGHVTELPARIVRVSFTGELSFEINVAPRSMRALWERIMEAGEPFGIEPVGSEASHVLRVEKGFLSLGHEVDGTVDAYDLGMDWIMSKVKTDYIGKRSVELRRAGGVARRELVGLLPTNPNERIPEGAPLTAGGEKVPTEGFVSACVWSVVMDRWIALALLEDGRSRIGAAVHARLEDSTVISEVTAPIFYDPDGGKLRS